MTLTKTSYSMISGAIANVLDYGADPTGATSSSDAFAAALATGKKVWIPKGTYLGNSIVLPGGAVIEGEGRDMVFLNTNANDAGFFTFSSIFHLHISNLSAGVEAGITNARFIKQTDLTNYLAYANFENIETRAEFIYSYEVFCIFTSWDKCRDGYVGTPGATHVWIKCIPGSFSQVNQCNMCQVSRSQVFSCTGTMGAISLEWGNNWSFRDVDFEANSTYAIKVLGIRNITLDTCWFEGNATEDQIYLDNSNSPNVQGSDIELLNTWFAGQSGNLAFLHLRGASWGAVKSLKGATIPSGCVLVRAQYFANPTLVEMWDVVSLSGIATDVFLNGTVALRPYITFNAVGVNSITSGTVNGTTPASTGININASTSGRTYLIIWSFQTSTGNATASSLYMIRCGESGDNYTATKISGDQGGTVGYDVITFSVVSSVLYVAGAGAGNGRFGVLGN